MTAAWAFIAHILGIDGPSAWSNFWSGFGSGPVAWCIMPLVYYWHHMCHKTTCLRIGHPDNAGVVKCRKHLQNDFGIRG